MAKAEITLPTGFVPRGFQEGSTRPEPEELTLARPFRGTPPMLGNDPPTKRLGSLTVRASTEVNAAPLKVEASQVVSNAPAPSAESFAIFVLPTPLTLSK